MATTQGYLRVLSPYEMAKFVSPASLGLAVVSVRGRLSVGLRGNRILDPGCLDLFIEQGCREAYVARTPLERVALSSALVFTKLI